MNNVNSYIILNRKIDNIINIFIIITVILLILLSILLNTKYKKYYYLYGQVDTNYNLILYTKIDKINTIKNNNTLYIDNISYNYIINSIDNNYIVLNNTNYIKIEININLKKEDKMINNILKIKVYESNKKLFNYLIDYIKKG